MTKRRKRKKDLYISVPLKEYEYYRKCEAITLMFLSTVNTSYFKELMDFKFPLWRKESL